MRVSRDSLTAVPFGIATLALGLAATGLAYGVLSAVFSAPSRSAIQSGWSSSGKRTATGRRPSR